MRYNGFEGDNMKFLKNNEMLEIADATENDAEEILEYLKTVGGESDNLTFGSEGIGIPLEKEKKYIKSMIEDNASGLFVGKINGKIVSVAGIDTNSKKRLSHNAEIGISVMKEHWNKGIGKNMMEFIINFARIAHTIKNLTLEVKVDNVNAIKLYKNLGFKEIGRFKDRFFIEDKYYDSIIMEFQI